MKKILALIILVLLGYTAYNGLVIIDKGGFAVIQDRESDKLIRIVGEGYSFVPESLLFWRVKVERFYRKNIDTFRINIPITPLEDLASPLYAVSIPINVVYEIDPAHLMADAVSFNRKAGLFHVSLKKLLEECFSKDLAVFFTPRYDRNRLEKESSRIIDAVHGRLKEKCSMMGIVLTRFELAGAVFLPDVKTYQDGIRYLDELRSLEKNNKKELLILEGNLKKEEIVNRKNIEKLKEISALVKANPLLLRYMYIEKLGGNVKLIITDKDGVPFHLDESSSTGKAKKKNEIDNLR
mgnify:FL=1